MPLMKPTEWGKGSFLYITNPTTSEEVVFSCGKSGQALVIGVKHRNYE